MIIDVHCHYALTGRRATVEDRLRFEPGPAGDGADRPTDYDSCVSRRALNKVAWRLARWWMNLPAPGDALDARLETDYARHLLGAGPIDRSVLLAFDAVHDDDGRCQALPVSRRALGSDIYSSNTFIRDVCRRHGGRLLFGASVHPYRDNAEACIEEVFAAGACLIKWMPLHHNIDFGDDRTRRAMRACARLGLPILVHCSQEFTLTTHRRAYESVAPLLEALQQLRQEAAMPTTIVAHVATPVWPLAGQHDHRMLMEAMLGEFADAPLYADISALAAWAKVGYLRRLARRPEVQGKLLFGSDFPIPPAIWRLRRQLGRSYREIVRLESWPQQAAVACQTIGIDDIVFQRAAELLPNVHAFDNDNAAVSRKRRPESQTFLPPREKP